MSSVIDLLEQLGEQPAQVDLAERVAGLHPKQQDALLAGDGASLAVLIGARSTLCCTVFAPEDEPVPNRETDVPVDEPTNVPDDSESRAA